MKLKISLFLKFFHPQGLIKIDLVKAKNLFIQLFYLNFLGVRITPISMNMVNKTSVHCLAHWLLIIFMEDVLREKRDWSHIGKKVSLCFSVLSATCRLVMECFCAYMIPQAKRKASFKEGQEIFFSQPRIDFSKNVLFLALNQFSRVCMQRCKHLAVSSMPK